MITNFIIIHLASSYQAKSGLALRDYDRLSQASLNQTHNNMHHNARQK